VDHAGFFPDAADRLRARQQGGVKKECRSHAYQYA
jgi:hypothetical protein